MSSERAHIRCQIRRILWRNGYLSYSVPGAPMRRVIYKRFVGRKWVTRAVIDTCNHDSVHEDDNNNNNVKMR